MKTVVLVSADAEWAGVKPLFPDAAITKTPFGESMKVTLDTWDLTLFHSGWGKIASATSMQYVIDHYSPDLIVNLGTCGGFEGVAERGDLILVDRAIVYNIIELMDASDVTNYYASSLDLNWLTEPHPYPARRGLIASADSDLLPEKIPFIKASGALAADWESAALAWVATRNNKRILILRMVSDLVSEHGGEAYDDIEIFKERSREIMRLLFEQLPDWLDAVRS
jgi:adenosylhomocysteine nucleosidase